MADAGVATIPPASAASAAASDAPYEEGRIWLLAPPLLFLAAFLLVPMTVLVAYGFYSQDPLTGIPVADLTLENYRLILTDPLYYQSIFNSVEVTMIVSIICLIVGYPVAYFIAIQAPVRWQAALLLLVILPEWTSLLIRSFSWVMVLRPNGLLDWMVERTGLVSGSLDLLYTRPAVIIGLVHIYLPFMVLGIHASLRSLDLSLVAAARDLGATSFSAFRRVVLPLTLPGIATGLSLVALPVFGAFITPRILGGTSEVLIGNLVEIQFKQLANWPLGAALATVVSLVLLLGVAGLAWLGRPRA
jgi:spermidine/putrescine transport system permease protein